MLECHNNTIRHLDKLIANMSSNSGKPACSKSNSKETAKPTGCKSNPKEGRMTNNSGKRAVSNSNSKEAARTVGTKSNSTEIVSGGLSHSMPMLKLNELDVDVTGNIIVMIGRVWDVHNVTRRYLSTDFVVSDSEGNIIHCTAKSSVSHNFLRMKEGGIYSIKNFVVLPNKDEFRIFRDDKFMIEFDGETSARKVTLDPQGFIRYPFRLITFDQAEPANNKYLIDIAGYVTSVGRTNYTKTGSKTLEFYLANESGQTLRVTLWGDHGDVLVDKKTRHAGVCAMVLTGMSVKEYNNKVYLSSTSATVFCDDDDIPCLQELRSSDSRAAPVKAPLPIDCTHPREGTLENLLIWARNRHNQTATFHCNVTIEGFKTKKGWNYPSCGYEKCRKGASRKKGMWVCEACNRSVEYPVFRYRLEAVVTDGTAHAVVVLFNDTATEMLKCSAESIMGTEDYGADGDDDLNLPLAIRNLIGTTHVMEIKSHSYYEYGNFESFNCWKLNPSEKAADDASSSTPTVTLNEHEHSLKTTPNQPSVSTPLKPNEASKQKGHELEDSDVDEVMGPVTRTGKSRAKQPESTKKRKRYVVGETDST